MNDEVRLRDKRKPGHCWQDNELYDAFAPIVGGDAVLVYVQMTRHCYGTEIRSSSRELAEACGKSKDTVQRAVKVMERVGMVRATAGGSRRLGEWQLVDLKELAIAYGASYDARRASYVLPSAKEAELRAAVRETLAAMQRKKQDASGAQSARLPEPEVALGAPELALQKDTSGAPEGHATSYYLQDTKQQDIPPPTPTRERVGADGHDRESITTKIAELQRAAAAAPRGTPQYFATRFKLVELRKQLAPVERMPGGGTAPPAAAITAPQLAAWLMAECGFHERNARRPALGPVLETVIAAAGPEVLPMRAEALAMRDSWRWYERVQARWGPKAFFAEGHWRRPRSWPPDPRAEARVGGMA